MVDGCFSHIHWSQAAPMVKVEETENLRDWCMLALLTILRVEYHEVPLGCRVGQISLRFFAWHKTGLKI